MKKIYILHLVTFLSLGCANNSFAATTTEAETKKSVEAAESDSPYSHDKTILLNIGLEDEQRSQVASALNTLLANEYVLYTKTLKFHWNVRGKHFGALHTLFENQYKQLLDIVDRVAERVRALGKLSMGTLEEFICEADLSEDPEVNPRDSGMIRQLLHDHEYVIYLIRKYSTLATNVHDDGTVNMLGDIIETHEKIAWTLRAHLE